MRSLAKSKLSTPTLETEVDSLLEPENDVGSVFSSFSTDDSDTYSLPSISKADGLFSEPMLNIKAILGQLTRISTAIRQSGAKYRYRKADASLKKKDFEEFKTHLTVVILMNSVEAKNEEPAERNEILPYITDSEQLTEVQKRLINANIVRRNRIMFATRSMKPIETPIGQQQQQARAVEVPIAAAEPTPRFSQEPTKRISDGPAIPPQVPSIMAPSITQTATEMGSQFNLQHAVEPKKSTPSVITRVTQTGATQDYPSCPEPISDELLQCPYCADLLPAIYSNNQTRWRYDIESCAIKDSMS